MKRLLACLAGLFFLVAGAAFADPALSENLYSLLAKIARAPSEVSFSGSFTEVDVYNGASRRMVVDIVHRTTGEDRVVIVAPPALAARFRGRHIGTGMSHFVSPGSFRIFSHGFRSRLNHDLSLLLANYTLRAESGVRIAGRDTYEIEFIPKYPDRETKEIWVDAGTGIVLRASIDRPFNSESRLVSFTSVRFSPDSWTLTNPAEGPRGDLPAPFVPPGGSEDGGPWIGALSPEVVRQLDGYARSEPFVLLSPAYLPTGFILDEVGQFRPRGRFYSPPGVHILYTDGLSSISLFLQVEAPLWPNRIREFFLGDPAARRVQERGFTVFEGMKCGTRYVLVSDIGGDELAKMASSLRQIPR